VLLLMKLCNTPDSEIHISSSGCNWQTHKNEEQERRLLLDKCFSSYDFKLNGKSIYDGNLKRRVYEKFK